LHQVSAQAQPNQSNQSNETASNESASNLTNLTTDQSKTILSVSLPIFNATDMNNQTNETVDAGAKVNATLRGTVDILFNFTDIDMSTGMDMSTDETTEPFVSEAGMQRLADLVSVLRPGNVADRELAREIGVARLLRLIVLLEGRQIADLDLNPAQKQSLRRLVRLVRVLLKDF